MFNNNKYNNNTTNLNWFFFSESKQFFSSIKKKHPFHIVTNSPWPLFVGFSVLGLTISFVSYMHSFYGSLFIFFWSFIFLLISVSNWWYDVAMEATYEGEHTLKVQKMYNTSFLLFLISELFFFITLFWAFFHYGQQPNIHIGVSWIPVNVRDFTVSHIAVPAMLNMLLIISSVTITFAHHFVDKFNRKYTLFFLLVTIVLGFSFTTFQYVEYIHTPINFAQTSFGALLYLLTGFHGSHVIIGTVFLAVCFVRFYSGHFSSEHRIGFEFAIIYWHFVDFIWLFVLVLIYISNLYYIQQRAFIDFMILFNIYFEYDSLQNLWFLAGVLGDEVFELLLLTEPIFDDTLPFQKILLINSNGEWVYPYTPAEFVMFLEIILNPEK
jgi:heme/copper-type cytochrome/quinol oxidase subunit 3